MCVESSLSCSQWEDAASKVEVQGIQTTIWQKTGLEALTDIRFNLSVGEQSIYVSICCLSVQKKAVLTKPKAMPQLPVAHYHSTCRGYSAWGMLGLASANSSPVGCLGLFCFVVQTQGFV